MKHQRIQQDGIDFVLIDTDKFKTIHINCSFETEFDTKRTAARTLLSRLLRNSTLPHPSKRSMALALQDLYDARLGVSYARVGRASLVNVSLSTVNDAFLSTENGLLPKGLSFLNEVIHQPNVENGLFLQSKLDEERRLLIDEIKAVYNNKGRYALNELMERMCSTELYGSKVYGTIEEIEAVTTQDVTEEYRILIEKSKVYIYAAGDGIDASFVEMFLRNVSFKSVETNVSLIDRETRIVDGIREFIKIEPLNQSKLNIGFRTNILVGDSLYYAMLVLGSLLGGHASSRLFRIIREENSLAYNISTIYGLNKGVMVIVAGIDASKYAQVMDLITKEIEEIRNGVLDPDLIELTKINLNNELMEILDSPSGMIGVIQKEIDFIGRFDLEEMKQSVAHVTKEEIIEAAKTLVLDSIFLLASKEVPGWTASAIRI